MTASENGWQPAQVGADACEWVTVPGANVTLQIQRGQPLAILRAWAADFNAYVEPLRDADSACWTPTNSVPTSNHLNGTAVDLNWNSHPFQVAGTYNAAQMETIRQLLDFYEGTVFWGGDWTDPIDEMHWNLGYDTYGNPHTADFIARKIRADGFSTFRRGDPTPPAPAADAVAVLAAAAGISRDKAAEILPTLSQGLQLAQCTTVNRIAMWLAQCGHESDGFNTTEEYAKNGRYAPYIGRTWIQITWDYNYAKFGQWAAGHGLLDDPNYFVNNPAALADMQWAGIGPAWYWTVEQPRLNEFSDAGNVEDASKAINAPAWIGTPNRANGIADRTARWNRALAQGDALLTLTTDGDDMFTDADRDLLKQIAEYRRESRSRLRWPHQGPVDTCAGFAWNADAFGHEASVDRLATTYGDPWAIANLYAVINTDEPNREGDIELAKRILAKVPKKFITAANADIQAWLDAEAQYQTADA